MAGGRVERDFERWRRRGDAAALERVFDAVSPELYGLAAHLAPTPAEAEDLVQGTFLVALERARAWDGERRLVPWLVGILARRAGRARREASRRPDPERSRPSEAPRPDEAAAASELSGELARALAELSQADRQVLAPHLLEGKRPVEIAAELGRPPGTVRMQLMRGLERLRRALPPGFAAGGWGALVPRGPDAVRETVLASGRELALASALPASTVSLAGSLLTFGGLAMSWKWLVSAGVVVALAAGVWRVSGTELDTAASEVATLGEPEAPVLATPEEPEPEARVVVDETTAAPDTPGVEPVEATEALAAGRFLVVDVYVPEGVDPARTKASVSPANFDLWSETVTWSRTDPSGRVELDLTKPLSRGPATELMLTITHEDCLPYNEMIETPAEMRGPPPDERLEIRREVTLRLALGVRGRVVVPSGRGVGELRVGLYEIDARGNPRHEPVTDTDFDENEPAFQLKVRKPGRYLFVADGDELRPRTIEVTIPGATMVDLGPVELEAGGATIAGQVELPCDLSGADCRITARRLGLSDDQYDASWRATYWVDGQLETFHQATRSDETGRFVLTGLTPGRWSLGIESHPKETVIDPGTEWTTGERQAVVGRNLGRIGVCLRQDGLPVHAAEVAFEDGQGTLTLWANGQGCTDALLPLDRDYTVRAQRDGYGAGEVFAPAAGRPIDARYEIVLGTAPDRGATLRVRTRLPADHPMSEAMIWLVNPKEGRWERKTCSVSDGDFVLRGLDPGRCTVVVEPQEGQFLYSSYMAAASFETTLVSGETSVHEVVLEEGGRVRVRIANPPDDVEEGSIELYRPDGSRVADLRGISRAVEGNRWSFGSRWGGMVLNESTLLYPNLPPGGPYRFRVLIEGRAPVEETVTVSAGRETELVVRIPD